MSSKLLEVLHRLVDQGNTVVVIEHNLEVIKTADWVIDWGPEGATAGPSCRYRDARGHRQGTRSHTGQFLREALQRRTA